MTKKIPNKVKADKSDAVAPAGKVTRRRAGPAIYSDVADEEGSIWDGILAEADRLLEESGELVIDLPSHVIDLGDPTSWR